LAGMSMLFGTFQSDFCSRIIGTQEHQFTGKYSKEMVYGQE